MVYVYFPLEDVSFVLSKMSRKKLENIASRYLSLGGYSLSVLEDRSSQGLIDYIVGVLMTDASKLKEFCSEFGL